MVAGVMLGVKSHSLSCHLVDVGCMDVWLTIASQITISHIIAEDEEDIRLLHILLSPHKGRQANDAYSCEPYCFVCLHKKSVLGLLPVL